MKRRKESSKGRIYLAILILIIAVFVWLGVKDIPNTTQEVVVDVTEQIKTAK